MSEEQEVTKLAAYITSTLMLVGAGSAVLGLIFLFRLVF